MRAFILSLALSLISLPVGASGRCPVWTKKGKEGEVSTTSCHCKPITRQGSYTKTFHVSSRPSEKSVYEQAKSTASTRHCRGMSMKWQKVRANITKTRTGFQVTVTIKYQCWKKLQKVRTVKDIMPTSWKVVEKNLTVKKGLRDVVNKYKTSGRQLWGSSSHQRMKLLDDGGFASSCKSKKSILKKRACKVCAYMYFAESIYVLHRAFGPMTSKKYIPIRRFARTKMLSYHAKYDRWSGKSWCRFKFQVRYRKPTKKTVYYCKGY